MSRLHGRLVGVCGSAVLLALALVAVQSCTSTSKPTRTTSRTAETPLPEFPPEAYVGSDTCKACHEEAFQKFAHTKMGRLMVNHPRDFRERLACESCHGPGKAHVDAGGGKGVGGMITFAKNDPTPLEVRTAICLSCHKAGSRLFWQSSTHEAREVGCTSCHTVMVNVTPRFQLSKETNIDTCGACHLQKRAQQMRTSHMPLREGKMDCSSCHNP